MSSGRLSGYAWANPHHRDTQGQHSGNRCAWVRQIASAGRAGSWSNSHGVVAAGIDTHMTFQVAVSEGDVLIARATEVTRNAKLAVYRVDVTRDDGTVVSSFTGTVYVTGRPHAAHPHGI